jgi:DNA-binding XRE family transcriptional regulator
MDEIEVSKNIFHELNKMLISISKDYVNSDLSFDSLNRSNRTSDRIQYYLQFPTKPREEMANLLGISSKTLSRIYEEPLQILNNYEITKKLAKFFHYSYPQMISIFFSVEEEKSTDENHKNDSILMNKIQEFETKMSREQRRSIARILHIILSLEVDIQDFVDINTKLVQKKCYKKEPLNRIHNFIDHI